MSKKSQGSPRPASLLRSLDRFLGGLSAGLAYVAAFFVGIAMIAVLADVIGRAMFDHPVRGVPELGRYLVVAIALLGIPYAMRTDAHIKTTLTSTWAPRMVTRVIALSGDVLAAGIFTLAAIYAWEPMITALEQGTFDGESVRFPTFPTRLVVLVSSAVMALESVSALYRHFRSPVPGDSPIPPVPPMTGSTPVAKEKADDAGGADL